MAVMMIMEWKGVTPEQYEQLRKVVNWEGQEPSGAICHMASFGDGAAHVTDVWDSAAAFDTFLQERLMPGVQKVGVAGQPDAKIYPLHAAYVPHAEKLKA